MDLIDRYKKWQSTHSEESDVESENDAEPPFSGDDSEWNLTVKGQPTHFEEKSRFGRDNQPELIQSSSELDLNRIGKTSANQVKQSIMNFPGVGKFSNLVGHNSSLDISHNQSSGVSKLIIDL